ncbi:MAG: ABC transporter ATP-binding protein [Rickettsiales bacterium]|nr:ABC transporter ATP-binding protein [Rickettsiales bacterium]
MLNFDFNLEKVYKPFNNDLTRPKIFKYLKLILGKDLKFLYLAILYSVLISIFTLALPISVQLLINSVAFVTLTQPIIVLGLVLFVVLVFSGILNIFQTYLVEIFQRKFFARMSAEISMQIYKSDHSRIQESNQTELVNRFFDVTTVQKIVPKFVTETASLILQVVFGLILVAFYHPALLLFNVFVILAMYLIWNLFYRKSTLYAFVESRRKYDMAGWLEEIARNTDSFKSEVAQKYARLKVNFLTQQYLKERKKHFYYLFRQIIALFLLYAIANALLLIFGGYLVINNQLSLGQLVASELVLSAILYRISKFGKDFENFYDLVAACEKLSQFYNIPLTSNKGISMSYEKLDITFEKVEKHFLNDDYQFNLRFEDDKSYLISTNNSSTQALLMDLLKRYELCDRGSILFNNNDIKKININNLHSKISTIDDSLMIEGNLREYLTLNLKTCEDNLEQLLDDLGVMDFMKKNNLDLNSRIIPSGWPFFDNEKVILKVAKAILEDPKVIIINEIFDTIRHIDKKRIMHYLMKHTNAMIICFANVRYEDIEFDEYLYINNQHSKSFKNIKNLLQYERMELLDE